MQGSSLVRAADSVLLTDAGPEIGVASTKAFTAQVAGAYLAAVRLGRAKGALSEVEADAHLAALRGLRGQLEQLLSDEAVAKVREVAAGELGQATNAYSA